MVHWFEHNSWFRYIVCADVRCVVNCNQAQNIRGLYRDLVIISFLSTKFQVVMYIHLLSSVVVIYILLNSICVRAKCIMMKILLALRVSTETLGKGFLLRPRPSAVGLVTERQKVTTKKVLKELLVYWKMSAGYIT